MFIAFIELLRSRISVCLFVCFNFTLFGKELLLFIKWGSRAFTHQFFSLPPPQERSLLFCSFAGHIPTAVTKSPTLCRVTLVRVVTLASSSLSSAFKLIPIPLQCYARLSPLGRLHFHRFSLFYGYLPTRAVFRFPFSRSWLVGWDRLADSFESSALSQALLIHFSYAQVG